MLYLLAIFCPPLAVLLCGRPFMAIFVFLASLLIFPGMLLALLIVSSHYADQRSRQIVKQLHKGQVAATKQNYALYKTMERQARAAEAQAAMTAELLKRQQSQPAIAAQPNPASLPGPVQATAAETVDSESEDNARPVQSRSVGDQMKEFADLLKTGYGALPEWGQPVVWGLAAATPFVLVMLLVMVLR